ncbi:hypothetical protein CTRI78_v011225 [Colletotrichum trifolii]|uniref:BTB domain-containing protein n=1 Tax=Colletotrichum trifolii TaxID=5466 RepID=A0A4R8QDR7_COLTR|nr:hypothetical protein CTRI78_v011225 [Colletotrichum trifolii]
MVDDVFHTIDPKGDVLLILRSPNAPFAVWDVAEEIESLAVRRTLKQGFPSPNLPPSKHGDEEWRGGSGLSSKKGKSKKEDKKKKKKTKLNLEDPDERLNTDIAWNLFSTVVTSRSRNESQQLAEVEPLAEPEEEPAEDPEEDPEEEPEFKYLVSSRHLALASSKFEAELKGPWMEGFVNDIDGYHHINASEWDPDALLILMRIFHGQTRSVPRDISLEMLAKIAVLVDYYDAPEVVEVYANIWIDELEGELPTQHGRDMVLWLLVSHVFQQENVFSRMTQIAVTQSLKPVPTLGLPIPSIVVDLVDWQRQKAVDYIMNTLQGLLDDFRTESSGCSFECSSMLLGALTKEMGVHKLLNPPPKEPYIGYSIVDTEKMVNDFRCPQWNHPRRSHHSYYSETPDACNLKTIISTRLTAQPNGVEGGFKISEIQTISRATRSLEYSLSECQRILHM